jgi:hypothetical protein
MMPKTKWTSRRVASPNHAEGVVNDLVEFKNGELFIRHFYRAAHQPEHTVVSLEKFWLPVTPFTNRPTSITEREDLMGSLAKCVEIYARRNSITKSSTRRISAAVFSIVKFFEYGWLNGAYALSDWTPQLSSQLFEDLKIGGWPYALKIVDRTTELIENNRQGVISCLRFNDPNRGPSLNVPSIRRLLGTNLFGAGLKDVRNMVLLESGNAADAQKIKDNAQRTPSVQEAGMSAGMLIFETLFMNLLGEIAPPYGLTFAPFPMASMRATKEARGKGRTPTLRPEEVSQILVDANRWVYEVAPKAIFLLEQIVTTIEDTEVKSNKDVWKICAYVIDKSVQKNEIERLLEIEICGLHIGKTKEKTVGIRSLIDKIQAACFCVIGLLNARRRDEIQHPVIGMQRSSMRCVDERLELFQCDFYIEKTYKDRIPFFVGKFTADAVKVLCNISDLARRLRGVSQENQSERDGDASLFEAPLYRLIGSRKPLIFSYARSMSRQIWNPLPSSIQGPRLLRPHMFRRAYALIHHYRYENGDLLSLADQLGHLDLESVRIYVTDGKITKSGEADIESYARLTPEQRSVVKADIEELLSNIDALGRERVAELVENVLAGRARYSGGFGTLVTRLHQRLGRRLEYQMASPEIQQKHLGKFLVDRGHVFKPFAHGNCASSPSRRNRGAGCYSESLGGLDQAAAAPIVCAKCPYHVVSTGHLDSLRREQIRIKHEISIANGDSIQGRQCLIELENLTRAISLHEDRLGMGG